MHNFVKIVKKLSYLILFLGIFQAGLASTQPLAPEKAFVVSAKVFDSNSIIVSWQIAPGIYLYKDRIHFSVVAPTTASLGTLIFPKAIAKSDAILGHYEVYKDQLQLAVPIINPDPTNTVVNVNFQGCAENTYCYPPMTQRLDINFETKTVTISSAQTPEIISEQDHLSSLLEDGHMMTIILTFLGIGILLAFTPCVLPMIPILSGIIIGQKDGITAGKATILSSIYVLSMAITYALAGVLVSYAGGSIQAWLQQPWVLILFSLVFVVLALSLFGFYHIKLPARFEERIAQMSRKQKGGHYLGVAIMGCLATLIVSPCVTPALIGTLAFIGQKGNPFLGAIALFFLGLGMGIPLIIMAAAGGKLLPKAGHWMKTVENIFGVFMLAVALWLLERVLPAGISMLLWAALFIVCAVFMGGLSTTPSHRFGKLSKGLGLVFLVYGIVLVIGAAQGSQNPWQPLKLHPLNTISTNSYTTIKNINDLNTALSRARQEQKPVMIDAYADWCIACKEMDAKTLANTNVQSQLNYFTVLRIDLTKNTKDNQKLLKYLNIVAPPTYLFYDAKGKALPELTVVGNTGVSEFMARLQRVLTIS